MVQVFDGGVVEADVVRGPADAELVALGGELADEVGEVPVVRVATGGPAQDGDGLAGGAIPVAVEGLGSRVEGHESGVVDRSGGGGIQLGVQRPSELVGGQEVEAVVADERGGAGDGVEGPLDVGPDPQVGWATPR